MKRKYFFILFFGIAISFYASSQTPDQLYLIYCSTCHGQHLEGGRAATLIKQKWLYGGDRKSIIKTISKGIPNTQMAKFETMLTTKQIEDITDYILSLQKKPAVKKKP